MFWTDVFLEMCIHLHVRDYLLRGPDNITQFEAAPWVQGLIIWARSKAPRRRYTVYIYLQLMTLSNGEDLDIISKSTV